MGEILRPRLMLLLRENTLANLPSQAMLSREGKKLL